MKWTCKIVLFNILAISSCVKIKYPIYTTITYTSRNYEFAYSQTTSIYYTFTDARGNKRETQMGRTITYEVFGDTYKFVYDSLNLNKRKVFFEEPVFLPNDKTAKTVGTIVKLNSRNCIFSYKLEGRSSQTYMKKQFFYKDTPKKYPQLGEGAKFEVRYDIHNVKRSIIYFDHPCDSTLVK
jgi:hypothetical protein